jgi:hypothetical protein
MLYITKAFSYFMHWIENLFLIFGFLFFELALAPLAYIKVWLNIIQNSLGFLKTVVNCVVWAIVGIPMMIFLLLLKENLKVYATFYYYREEGRSRGCRNRGRDTASRSAPAPVWPATRSRQVR